MPAPRYDYRTVVISPAAEAHRLGRVYAAGAAIATNGIAADRPVFQLENPANSDRLVNLYGLTVFSTIEAGFTFRTGATLPSPTAVTPMALNLAISPAVTPKAVARFDEVAPTGGTLLPLVARSYANAPIPLEFEAPIVLPPGVSITMAGDSNAAGTTAVTATWWETPLEDL